MTVIQIIKALELCFLNQKENTCSYCKECPVLQLNQTENCQVFLAENTIKKLNELTQLLDDTVNHHYYDTLEFYQEENARLTAKLEKIEEVVLNQ